MAILLVVMAHGRLVPVFTGGMVGVTLFFVLSGFLITHLLIRERETTGAIDLKAFYARRALRLLPALAVYLVAMALLIAVFRLAMPIWQSTWPPALYMANYAQILGIDINAHRHTWSLAVEEHFYLIWPLLVTLGVTKRLRILAGAVGLLAIWRLTVGQFDQDWAYMGTDTNAYALGLGCLLAAWRFAKPPVAVSSRITLYAVSGLGLLALVPHATIEQLDEMSVWLPLVAAALSVLAVWGGLDAYPAFLGAKPLRGLGMISYALYLWHAPLVRFPGLAETMLSRVIAVGIAGGLAWLSWRLVERPILRSRWRKRFHPQVALPDLGTTESALVVSGR